MYKSAVNSIQRARNSRGLTQEALAERCGYSVDTIRAWESGARPASIEALGILAECLESPWLPGVYLREQTNSLNELIPAFKVGRPLPEAAAAYISCIFEFIDGSFDRQLLRMVADGQIDAVEAPVYRDMMRLAERTNKAYFEMRFAEGGIPQPGEEA